MEENPNSTNELSAQLTIFVMLVTSIAIQEDVNSWDSRSLSLAFDKRLNVW